MNASKSALIIALVGTATLVNVYASTHRKDVVTKVSNTANVLLANAALALLFVGIGQFLSWNLAVVLAGIHLLSTMLTNGLPAIDWFTRLIGAK